MNKILMITGKDYDDSEVLYPYYRLIEEGYEVDVASVEKGEVLGKGDTDGHQISHAVNQTG